VAGSALQRRLLRLSSVSGLTCGASRYARHAASLRNEAAPASAAVLANAALPPDYTERYSTTGFLSRAISRKQSGIVDLSVAIYGVKKYLVLYGMVEIYLKYLFLRLFPA
jgi:hypothetical protein